MLDFALCDTNGRQIGSLNRRQGAKVTVGLRQRRTATVDVSFEDPSAGKVEPVRSVLKARFMGDPLFTGRILRPQFRGRDRIVTMPAFDPGYQLEFAFLGMWPYSGGLVGHEPGLDFRLVDVDQSEIMARLIEYADPSDWNESLLDENQLEGIPRHGLVRGNLTPTRTRTREYDLGKQIQEAVEQLGEVIGAVDWEYEPVDRDDGTFAQLNTYFPWQGEDRRERVVWEYNCGMNNVADFTHDPSGDMLRNRSVWAGRREESTGGRLQPIVWRNNRMSELQFGVWGRFVGDPDITTEETLGEHADDDVSNYAWTIDFFTFTPATDDGEGWVRTGSGGWEKTNERYGRPFRFAPSGDFWIGDVIKIIARDRPALDVELEGRVVGGTINELPNGAIVPEIVCASLISGGNVVRGIRPPSFVRDFASIKEDIRRFMVSQ